MTPARAAVGAEGAALRARPAPAWRAASDAGPFRTWRDDVRLSAVVSGYALVTFGPGAWVVVDRLSADLVAFVATITVQWFAGALAQCAMLRWLERTTGGSMPIALKVLVVGTLGAIVTVYPVNEAGIRIGLSQDSLLWRIVAPGISSLLLTCFMVWVREGRDRERAASLRLFRLQQAQLAARRSVVETQLRAVQARVDPQFFFDTLDAAERLYGEEPARAEALLDALVEFLRAALPRVDGASSVLAHELELASAAVRIAMLATGRVHEIEIDVQDDLGSAPFPSGVLLPLVRSALDAASDCGGAVAIVVRRADGVGPPAAPSAAGPGADPATKPIVSAAAWPAAVDVVVRSGAAPRPAVVADVGGILHDLFGSEASLVIVPASTASFHAIVRIPHADDR